MHRNVWSLLCMALVLGLVMVIPAHAAELTLTTDQVDTLPFGTPVYGFSTLDPSGPQRFQGRLLGIMYNTIGPGHDWIVVQLNSDTNPVIAAGQSGSPMYVEQNKKEYKIGTLSYGDTWARNPICYLTPINEVLHTSYAQTRPIQPPVTPTSYSLVETLRRLMPTNDPLRPMMMAEDASSGVAVHGIPGPVVPGTVLGVQLAWGDFDYTSWGTVSHVDGDRVYMFGHPFLKLGPAEYRLVPMKVLTVQQRYDRSYILAAPIKDAKPVGIIEQDRETAIFGTLGKEPQNAIPVTISLTTSDGKRKEFKFFTCADSAVGPLLIGAGVATAIASWSRELGDMTLFVNGQMQVEGLGDVSFSDSFTKAEGPFEMLREKTSSVLGNRFAKARIKSVRVEAKVFDEFRRLTIDSAGLDQPNFKPGDTLNLKVTLGQPLRDPKNITLAVPLPPDLQYGVGKIIVGDQSAIADIERGTTDVVNLTSLVKSLNQERRPDAVYVYIVLPPSRIGPPVAEEPIPMKVGDIDAKVLRTSKRLSSNVEEFQIVIGDFQVDGRREVEFKVGTTGEGLPPGHPPIP